MLKIAYIADQARPTLPRKLNKEERIHNAAVSMIENYSAIAAAEFPAKYPEEIEKLDKALKKLAELKAKRKY